MDGETGERRKPAIQECSAAARLLGERLSIAAEGDVITYEEADKLTGGKTRGPHRHYWRTAREIARREADRVFVAVRSVGYRCLTNHTKAPVLHGDACSRMHRTSNRLRRNLDTIDMTPLNSEQRLAAVTAMTHAQFLASATSDRAAKRLSNAVERLGAESALTPPVVSKELFRRGK